MKNWINIGMDGWKNGRMDESEGGCVQEWVDTWRNKAVMVRVLQGTAHFLLSHQLWCEMIREETQRMNVPLCNKRAKSITITFGFLWNQFGRNHLPTSRHFL